MKSSAALLSMFLICNSANTSQPTSIESKPPAIALGNFEGETLYQLLIAEMALNRKDLQTALSAYSAAAQDTQDPDIAAKATDLAILLNRPRAALITAKIWADKLPQDMEAQAITALLLMHQQQNNLSIPYLTRLQMTDAGVALGYFEVLYEQLKSPQDKAFFVGALNNLREKYPHQLGASLALTNIYLTENQPEASLALSTNLLKQGLGNETLLIMHSEALRLSGQGTEAINFVESTLEKMPNLVDLRFYQIEILLKSAHMPEKARTHMIYLQSMPLTAQSIVRAINVSFEAGWLENAEVFLVTLQQDPNYEPMAAYFFGRIAEARAQNEQALNYYARVDAAPFYVIARIHAANILSHEKKYTEALALISDTYPETHADLKIITIMEVDLLSKLNRHEEALAALELGIADAPNDLDLRYIRSLLLEKLGKIQQAEQDLRYILQHKPRHAEALNGLGYLLTNYSDRHEEALTYLKHAHALAPNNPGILDSLGWVHYHLGNHAEAVSYLKAAHQMDPDILIAAHLGEVLWEMGDKENAVAIWKKAPKEANMHPAFQAIVNKYAPEVLAFESP